MNYYQIIVNKKVPYQVLTYKSEETIEIGQVVCVLLRKKLVHGLVVSSIEEDLVQTPTKITEISEIVPYRFSDKQISLLKTFSFNTFNDIHNTLDAFLSPILSLNQVQTKQLRNIGKTQKESIKPTNKEIKYVISPHIVLRIRDIIRISMLEAGSPQTILILAPEKKLIESLQTDLKELLVVEEMADKSYHYDIKTFYGDKSKSSRDAIMSVLDSDIKTHTIIFGTRSSLFLPFKSLTSILLLDEANSLHIQEQNGLYFDAREIAYMLSEVFSVSLYFISRVPSIRLHSLYNSKDIENYLLKDTQIDTKRLKLSVSRSNGKTNKYRLFSDSVLGIITANEQVEDKVFEGGDEEV
jgi:primosomal protein N'